MRWPWRRKPIVDTAEGRRALEEARRTRVEVERQWGKVNRLSRELRTNDQDDHFSELIRLALGARHDHH